MSRSYDVTNYKNRPRELRVIVESKIARVVCFLWSTVYVLSCISYTLHNGDMTTADY